jgi:lipoprotein-releasing system ATP-binding protein
MSEVLRAEGIRKDYRLASQSISVLRELDLALEEGEIVSVVGASGVGKSTLLHILGLLDRPDAGSIHYRGRDIGSLRGVARSRLRNEAFGFVFQFYHLIPELTAVENVLLPGLIAHGPGAWRRQKREARERAVALLERTGLGERLKHRPNQLSGGERQRVAIARAVFNRPSVLLCDEPTGNLDPRTSEGIRELLLEVNREERQTMVLVTHNEDLAVEAHRMFRMRDGRLEPVDGEPVPDAPESPPPAGEGEEPDAI